MNTDAIVLEIMKRSMGNAPADFRTYYDTYIPVFDEVLNYGDIEALGVENLVEDAGGADAMSNSFQLVKDRINLALRWIYLLHGEGTDYAELVSSELNGDVFVKRSNDLVDSENGKDFQWVLNNKDLSDNRFNDIFNVLSKTEYFTANDDEKEVAKQIYVYCLDGVVAAGYVNVYGRAAQ